MKLFCITYKGKPATANTLRSLNNLGRVYGDLDHDYTEAIVRKTKTLTIKAYLHNFGFTWKERPKGIEVSELIVKEDYKDKFNACVEAILYVVEGLGDENWLRRWIEDDEEVKAALAKYRECIAELAKYKECVAK